MTKFLPGLTLIIILLFGLYLYSSNKLPANFYNQSVIKGGEGEDEDKLSMYELPKDVALAMNQAEKTGIPVLGIRADGPSYHIPILMYHYVEHVLDRGDTIRISLNTLPETLDSQIYTLKQAGYSFITATDLADILDGIEKMPVKPVVLTFDDGYRDYYTDAFPILKKYNVKSVQYVISGFLNQPNHLTNEQLLEISRSKIVEIGAHTVHHLALAGASSLTDFEEINNSRIQLEGLIKSPVTSFAYPYGSFDISALQTAKKAGYRTAMSTLAGTELNNEMRFFVHRVRPGAATGQTLINLIENVRST